MQDVSIVTVFESEANLGEIIHDLFLVEHLSLSSFNLDLFVEISAVTILHYYVQITISVFVDIPELNDVWMT